MAYSSSLAADAVRRTIERMEANNPNDPKIAELRRRALLRLAEMQRRDQRRGSRLLLVRQPTLGK